jgi:hypothetical protein
LEVEFFWVSQFDTEAALGGLPLTDRWVVCIFPPLNLTFVPTMFTKMVPFWHPEKWFLILWDINHSSHSLLDFVCTSDLVDGLLFVTRFEFENSNHCAKFSSG